MGEDEKHDFKFLTQTLRKCVKRKFEVLKMVKIESMLLSSNYI